MHYKRVRKTGTTDKRAIQRKSVIDRFSAKYVEDPGTGCWVWTGAKDRKGYGAFNVDGKRVSAHRLSHELFVGPIPKGDGHRGTCVCHRCDNPSCVNPGHLFLGTNAENVADMNAKGRGICLGRSGPILDKSRMRRGERHPAAKLTAEDVAAIRNSPETGKALAAKYGVSCTTISRVRLSQSWREA